ncbi:MAG: DUF6798 domain-containing protein [Planctomycetaceae bacterium]
MSTSPFKRPVPVHTGLLTILQIVLIWFSFIGYSFYQAPIPAVNEPHYLTKAYHYWNPEWCYEDLFLQSSNAHLVFYQTFGLLTEIFPFYEAAVFGRLIALLLLAAGWIFCLGALLKNRWWTLPAAWIFLFFSSLGNLSGEWVVGGIESKVVAYGFLLFAWGHLLREEHRRAGAHIGLAIAFHPVIGVWGAISLGGALVWGFYLKLNPLPWRRLLAGFGLMLITSAPGLIPALMLLGGGNPEADYIQVYFRLGHHLDPMQFSPQAWLYYAALILASLGLRLKLPVISRERLFARVICVAMFIALAGLVIGFRVNPVEEMQLRSFRTGLLKFYFFRLADVFVPLGLSATCTLLLAQFYATGIRSRKLIPHSFRKWAVLALLLGLLVYPYTRPGFDPSYMNRRQQQDWMEACEWIRQNTPENSLFLTTRKSWAFTWYAHRSEYFCYKNMPQDAASLIEWHQRYHYQRNWIQQVWEDPESINAGQGLIPSAAMVNELKQETRATHYLLHNSMRLPQAPLFRNTTFAVYELE